MPKKGLSFALNIIRLLSGPLIIIILGVIFFFVYNTYLIDHSLESLKFSLGKVSAARTVEEAQNLKMMLSEVLIREVASEKLETVNIANLEFGQNIISEAKVKDQLKDISLIIANVVKEKEAKRSGILLKLDALNEKLRSYFLKVYLRLTKRIKMEGVEVSDLTLLDKAASLESGWQMEEAISSYSAFISTYPDYKEIGWVRLRLGYAHLKLGNLKDAERLFSAVAKEYLGSEEALVARSFLTKIKEIKRSLKEKGSLLDKVRTARTDEERQRIYYKLGVIDTYNFNLASARDFFKKVVEADPKTILAQKAQFNIGWSLKFQNDFEKSALVFEDVINIYAKGDIVLNAKYQLADTYHKSGRFEEAVAIYKNIAQDYKDKPIAPLAQFQAGYSYLYNINDPLQASEAFKTLGSEFKTSALANYAAVDLVPTLESRFRDFAFSLLVEGKYEKAKEAFIKAIEVNRGDAWSHAGLGSSYVRLDDPKQGFVESESAITILADEYTHAALGFIYEIEGKIEQAIDEYKKSIAKNKEYWVAHYNIARLYEIQARYDEAINEYKEAISIAANFPLAHANLGHANWFRGEALGCIEGYKDSLNLNPSLPEAHYNLGLIFAALGRMEEAEKELNEALKIAPDFKAVQAELERLGWKGVEGSER